MVTGKPAVLASALTKTANGTTAAPDDDLRELDGGRRVAVHYAN